MRLPVAILAGGLATRLRPITETIPKALVEVAGRPFAEHQVELLARTGHRPTSCSASGISASMIEEALGDGARWELSIRLRASTARRCSAPAARCAARCRCSATAFFVLYGDSYLDCDFAGDRSGVSRRAAGRR